MKRIAAMDTAFFYRYMRYHQLLCLITASLLTCKASAQQKHDVVDQQFYQIIGNYTDSLFQHGSSLKKCSSGYMFLRFNADRKGRIFNLQSNDGTPGFLDTIFKAAFKQATIKIRFVKAPRQPATTFLLPILYNLHDGCVIDSSGKKMGPMAAALKTMNDLMEPGKEGHINSFLHMLDFNSSQNTHKKQKSVPLSCIVLPPFELNTPRNEPPFDQ